jgi:molybdopterin-containing oxidoreductase family membrane subunit
MFFVVNCVNVGMWFERYVIIVSSLAQDYIPTSWGYFQPTWVDLCTLIGSFGLFLTLFLLFCRYLPMIAMAEIKAIMPQADPHAGHGAHDHVASHHQGAPGSRTRPKDAMGEVTS